MSEIDQSVLDIYADGRMTPEDSIKFEKAVKDGDISIPNSFRNEMRDSSRKQISPDVIEAYQNGTMTPDDKASFTDLLMKGKFLTPKGFQLDKIESPGVTDEILNTVKNIPSAIYEQATGEKRFVESTDKLPSYSEMPELNEMSVDFLQTAAATIATNPQETANIIKSQFPGIEIKLDEKGNPLLKSRDGNWYAIKPGFSMKEDLPKVLLPIAEGLAVGASGGKWAIKALKTGLKEGGVQAVQELLQWASGGDFDTQNVLGAGAMGSGGSVVGDVVGRSAKRMPIDELSDKGAFKQINKASGFGNKAKVSLAEKMQTNPDAVLADELLDTNLPIDILSDAYKPKTAAAVSRAQVGSDAQEAWFKSTKDASQKIDDSFATMGSHNFDGNVSISGVAEKVKGSLIDSREKLIKEASELREGVDKVINNKTRVTAKNLESELDDLYDDVGDSMSPEIKSLYEIVMDKGEDGMINNRLFNIKRDEIGAAMSGLDSTFGKTDKKNLGVLYDAMKKDRIENAERLGGLGQQMKDSNKLFSEAFSLKDQIKENFGKEGEKSIGSKMTQAIKDAASIKGDSGKLEIMMDLVPEDMKKEVLLTMIQNASKSKSGASMVKGGFGFSEYQDLYKGLQSNKKAMTFLNKTLGADNMELLRAKFVLSKRMTEARRIVKNRSTEQKGMLDQMNVNGLIENIMDSTIGKMMTLGAYGKIGPLASAIAPTTKKMFEGNADKLARKTGELFKDQRFKDLAIEIMKNKNIEKNTKEILSLKKFNQWALDAGIDKPSFWLKSALRAENKKE